MSNEKSTEVTTGATKRKKINTDGNVTKGTVGAALAAITAAIVIAAKPAKVILKIGKFAITKKP